MQNKKVGIIGVGNVGATLAFSLANNNICKEIILKDLRKNIVEAMALDISQATNASKSQTKITFAHNTKNFNNCDIIVITAGIPRKSNMSRDDLLLTNAKIMSSVINEIKDYNKNAIYIIVSNPLDAMVYVATKTLGIERNRVLGMAGILDSSRMCHFIQEKLGYGQGEIDAWVMGGHGDDMVPLVDYSTVQGKNLNKLLDKKSIEEIVQKTKKGGAQIVKLLETGSAYYAPAYSTYMMIEAILKNSNKTYPCAVLLEGEYGYKNIVAGVPLKLGLNGVEEIIELDLDKTQKEKFKKSINSVKILIQILENKFFK